MSEEKTIQQTVIKLVAEHLAVTETEVKIESRFIEDLGADSLDIVELIMAIEEEFGISVPDEDAEKILTIKDVISYIEEKQK